MKVAGSLPDELGDVRVSPREIAKNPAHKPAGDARIQSGRGKAADGAFTSRQYPVD